MLLRSSWEAVTSYHCFLHPIKLSQSLNSSKNLQGFSSDIHSLGDWQFVPQRSTIALECLSKSEGTSYCEGLIFGGKKSCAEMVRISSHIKKHQEEDTELKI